MGTKTGVVVLIYISFFLLISSSKFKRSCKHTHNLSFMKAKYITFSLNLIRKLNLKAFEVYSILRHHLNHHIKWVYPRRYSHLHPHRNTYPHLHLPLWDEDQSPMEILYQDARSVMMRYMAMV